MNFKKMKKKNSDAVDGPFQNELTHKVSKAESNSNKDDEEDDESEEDNDDDNTPKTEEDTNGGCDDCNSDDDLEAEDYVDYDQQQSLPNPNVVKNKKHDNMKKFSNDKQQKIIQKTYKLNVAPVNMLKGGERYYTNRAMDTRWKYINNNNRFKGGYPEGGAKRLRYYEGNPQLRNGKRRIKQFANAAGNLLLISLFCFILRGSLHSTTCQYKNS